MAKVHDVDIYPRYGQASAKRRSYSPKIIISEWLSHTLAQAGLGLLADLLPRHTYYPLIDELRISGVRLNRRRVRQRFVAGRGLLVNLGAGVKGKSGWINIDVAEFAAVNCVFDARVSLPFADNSVRAIYCEHFFEHIDYTEEVPCFLTECHRVLEPAGVIRLVVPDAGAYLRAYSAAGWDEIARLRGLTPDRMDPYFSCRYRTKMELINVIFRQGHEHKWAYDFETIEFVLRDFGFTDVVHQKFGESLLQELQLDSQERGLESLYVEARK